MLPFLIFLGFSVFAEQDSSDADDTAEPGAATPPDEPPGLGDDPSDPGPEPLLLVSDAELVGSDDADTFTVGEATIRGLLLETEGGDDQLVVGADEAEFFSSEIDLGDGNDELSITAEATRVDGGEGNDVLSVDGAAVSTILGGDGDDIITVTQQYSDPAGVDGGAGDDVIDITGVQNGGANGGDGNDLILLSGARESDTGYGSSADGGAGDDILRWDGTIDTASAIPDGNFFATSITGGDGADRFELTFTEQPGSLEDTNFQTAPDLYEIPLIEISDFEPGEDVLVLEPLVLDDSYTATEARLEEDTDAGTTTVTVRYESPTETTREVFVLLETTDVSFDDIEFVGTTPATLTTTQ